MMGRRIRGVVVRHRNLGTATLEMIIVFPVLLLLGLGVIQISLIFRAKGALDYAVLEAARAGSVAYASPGAVRDGLATGLVPLLGGAVDVKDYARARGMSRVELARGEALGWLRIRQVNPTSESFADWGLGRSGSREIPNDNLSFRPTTIGSTSGQTIHDSNLLKLKVTYGVPLYVPLVGRLIARTLMMMDPANIILYTAEPHPRVPVVASATVRMQSPPRESEWTRPHAMKPL